MTEALPKRASVLIIDDDEQVYDLLKNMIAETIIALFPVRLKRLGEY
jgi:hypothetical protein